MGNGLTVRVIGAKPHGLNRLKNKNNTKFRDSTSPAGNVMNDYLSFFSVVPGE